MKVKSTLLYGASGSFEEVTIKKWKRLRLLSHKSPGTIKRGLPTFGTEPVASINAIIAGQQKVKMIAAFMKNFGGMLSLGFQEYDTKIGWNSEFQKEMSNDAFTISTYGAAYLNGNGFKASKGSMLPTPVIITSADSTSKEITYEFDTALQYGQREDDVLNIFLLSGNTLAQEGWNQVQTCMYFPAVQLRSESTVTLTATDFILGEPDLYVFMYAFWSRNPASPGKKISSTASLSEFIST